MATWTWISASARRRAPRRPGRRWRKWKRPRVESGLPTASPSGGGLGPMCPRGGVTVVWGWRVDQAHQRSQQRDGCSGSGGRSWSPPVGAAPRRPAARAVESRADARRIIPSCLARRGTATCPASHGGRIRAPAATALACRRAAAPKTTHVLERRARRRRARRAARTFPATSARCRTPASALAWGPSFIPVFAGHDAASRSAGLDRAPDQLEDHRPQCIAVPPLAARDRLAQGEVAEHHRGGRARSCPPGRCSWA